MSHASRCRVPGQQHTVGSQPRYFPAPSQPVALLSHPGDKNKREEMNICSSEKFESLQKPKLSQLPGRVSTPDPHDFLINAGARLKFPRYPQWLSQEGQGIATVKDMVTDGGRKENNCIVMESGRSPLPRNRGAFGIRSNPYRESYFL